MTANERPNEAPGPSRQSDLDRGLGLGLWPSTLIVVVAALAGLRFAELGSGPDEALYTSISVELLKSADWLTPRLDGQPAWFKPPLLYWLSALSMRVLGASTFAARLPVAVCAVLACWVTGLLAGRLFGPSARPRAMLMLATSLGVLKFGRLVMMDMPLVLVTALAHYAVWRGGGERWRPWPWVVGVCAGLACLLKTPAFAALVAGPPLVFLALFHRHALRVRALVACGLTCLVIGAPWYVYSLLEHGRAFWAFYAAGENLGKLTGAWRLTGPFRMLTALGVFALPWALLALPRLATREAARGALRFDRPSEQTALCLIWMAGVLAVFLPLSTHLTHYLLPALPALILLCARTTNLGRRSRGALAVLFGAAVCALSLTLVWDFGLLARFATLGAALLLAAASVLAWRGRVQRSSAAFALGAALMLELAAPATLPRLTIPEAFRTAALYSYRLHFAPCEGVLALWRPEELQARLDRGAVVLVAREHLGRLTLPREVREVFSLPRMSRALSPSDLLRAWRTRDPAILFSRVVGLARPSPLPHGSPPSGEPPPS